MNQTQQATHANEQTYNLGLPDYCLSDGEDPEYAGAPDDMNLPEGKTCGDCAHYSHCSWLFGCARTNTSCDWSPSRFKSAPPPVIRKVTGRDGKVREWVNGIQI